MKVAKFDPNYSQNLTNTVLSQGGGVAAATGNSGGGGGGGGAPTGPASGDLGGSFPSPTVLGIQGTPVDALPAVATDYLDGTGHWTTPAGYVTNIDGGKEVINTIAVAGATPTCDLSLGNVQDVTLTADATFTFTGATAGVFCSFELFLRQDGTGGWVTTWPGSVIWPGGTPPTLSTTPSTVTVLAFGTLDGGTTWYGFPSHSAGAGRWELAVLTGSPPDPLYAGGDFLYILVP